MKWLPTQSVDLILTDPPYNISQYSTGNIPREGKITLNNDIADWDKKIINPVEYVDVFKRIIKPRGNIIIFAGYNQIGDWHKAFDSEFDTFQMFVWHKTIRHLRSIETDFVIVVNLSYSYGTKDMCGIFLLKKKCTISLSALFVHIQSD